MQGEALISAAGASSVHMVLFKLHSLRSHSFLLVSSQTAQEDASLKLKTNARVCFAEMSFQEHLVAQQSLASLGLQGFAHECLFRPTRGVRECGVP